MKATLKYTFCWIAMLFLIGINLNSQEVNESIDADLDKVQIEQVINTLFDGMYEGDSSKVHSVFVDEVLLQTALRNKEGKVILINEELSSFLTAVGTPHDEIWNEKLLSINIQLDEPMANVWTPYEFYIGDKFSHKGVNSFQLVKLDSQWKIVYLIDTRRR